MEINQTDLTQRSNLNKYIEDHGTVDRARMALEREIDMYEQNILGTPPNEDGSDIIIPNFLMVEYRELKKLYSSLMYTLEQNLDKCQE
jgi:hypothetical protein